jgi:hypothetical protein
MNTDSTLLSKIHSLVFLNIFLLFHIGYSWAKPICFLNTALYIFLCPSQTGDHTSEVQKGAHFFNILSASSQLILDAGTDPNLLGLTSVSAPQLLLLSIIYQLFSHITAALSKKTNIIGKVSVFQPFPQSPLNTLLSAFHHLLHHSVQY